MEDIYRGQVKRNKEAVGVFTADEDLQKAIESWVAKKICKIAGFMGQGTDLQLEPVV